MLRPIHPSQTLPARRHPWRVGLTHPTLARQDLHTPTASALRFAGNGSPPSFWVRLEQSMKALWQKIVAPFQRLSLWIQNRFRSPETVTPEKSPVEPAENPKNGSVPNLSIQPVTPGTPEVQESNSLLAPGTGEAGELVLSPVQEALNNAQQDKALQLQEDEALALQLQESAGGPQVMPTAPVANTPSLALMQELFDSDLTRIQFQQQGGNTCYLLSALDAIFHHPQGKQILAKIQITRTPDGYAVKFPGQPEVVNVKEQELVTDEKNLKLANGEQVYGVNSECKGVRILECAYSKLDPHPTRAHRNFWRRTKRQLGAGKDFWAKYEPKSFHSNGQHSRSVSMYR